MEKKHRLFLRNLPLNVTRNEIEGQFQEYGTIENVEIKEKKDLDGNTVKFAFINITASERSLNACFKHVNNVDLHGYRIHVEVAKESFLARLQREREEAASKASSVAATRPISTESSRVDTYIPKNTDSIDSVVVRKEKKDWEKDRVNVVRKFSNDEATPPTTNYIKRPIQRNSKEEKIKIPDTKGKRSEEKYNNHRVVVKKEITESEMKRLKSVQEKKMAFKAKEQVLRDALNAVDNKTWSNKIVFGDDIDLMEPSDIQIENQKNLFEDGEDEDEISWDKNEFKISGRIDEKLLKLQSNFGNDKRFTLDNRFIDDEEKVEKDDDEVEESSLQQEKKLEMDILQNILGKPVQMKPTNSTVAKRKGGMIRYDPTQNEHHGYEVTAKKPAPMKPNAVKKTLDKRGDSEVTNDIPVSKDTFYTISDALVDSLKQKEEFSLLRTFGNGTTSTDDAVDDKSNKVQKCEFNLTSRNPFKYDSSDNEGQDEEHITNEHTDQQKISNKFSWHDNLFFSTNDPRFQGAQEFFKMQPVPNAGFKTLRRELKQIVRTKIRKNMRKNLPWNRRTVKKM